MSGQQMETRAVSYEFEVEMKASADRVWRALVEETDGWWLPDFHMVGEGSKVHLDARAGDEHPRVRLEAVRGLGSVAAHTGTDGEYRRAATKAVSLNGPDVPLLHIA